MNLLIWSFYRHARFFGSWLSGKSCSGPPPAFFVSCTGLRFVNTLTSPFSRPGKARGAWRGSWPRSRRRAGSGPTPSRGIGWPRNERSLLLSEGSVCAPGHKARKSTKKAPNFRELRLDELRRIPIPRTSVNKGIKGPRRSRPRSFAPRAPAVAFSRLGPGLADRRS